MRNLSAYVNQCVKELDQIGIQCGNIVSVTVNTRAKSRWGQCKKVYGGYNIEINETLLDERNDEKGLKNTIIHELLHSCYGCMNHGENWKRLASKVYKEYGYNIKRTSSVKDKGICNEVMVEMLKTKQNRINYKIQCTECGHIYTRYRMCGAVENTENYRCGCKGCKGKLVRVY